MTVSPLDARSALKFHEEVRPTIRSKSGFELIPEHTVFICKKSPAIQPIIQELEKKANFTERELRLQIAAKIRRLQQSQADEDFCKRYNVKDRAQLDFIKNLAGKNGGDLYKVAEELGLIPSLLRAEKTV